MNFSGIKHGLVNARNFLKPVLQQDNIIDNGSSFVSWRSYLAGVGSNKYYPLEYQHLIDKRQYSFLLRDGSFFQFYYDFDSNGLRNGRAAYYPVPLGACDTHDEIYDGAESAQDRDMDDLSQHLLNIVDMMEENNFTPANTSHIRFDFDRSAKSHEPCHLQFGGINSLRIPSEYFPAPLAFIQLISGIIGGVSGHDIGHISHAKRCSHVPVLSPGDIDYVSGRVIAFRLSD